MEEKPPCDVCEHFRAKKGESTPCDTCLPELMPENYDAWKIYSIVSGQLIMSGSGPVDINHLAIYKAMEFNEVANPKYCFEQVTKLSRHMLEKTWEKAKDKK